MPTINALQRLALVVTWGYISKFTTEYNPARRLYCWWEVLRVVGVSDMVSAELSAMIPSHTANGNINRGVHRSKLLLTNCYSALI
jgi:hypothetical protein